MALAVRPAQSAAGKAQNWSDNIQRRRLAHTGPSAPQFVPAAPRLSLVGAPSGTADLAPTLGPNLRRPLFGEGLAWARNVGYDATYAYN